MGLNMENIHTPSVPSGPKTEQGSWNAVKQDKLSLIDLISEKQRVEGELSALSSVLDSHGVNMNTSLTTFDGFPRDDLDIAQIRTTRARIIRLRNDYKALMTKIEVGLHAHHAAMKDPNSLLASTSTSSITASMNTGSENHIATEPSFARIGGVASGSPAENAGLKIGDKVRRFGNVNWMNHEKLSKVAEIVQRHEGQIIIVKVVREESENPQAEELQLQLTPRRGWGGRGLLGCHISPL